MGSELPAGRVIENPISGERILIRTGREESGGDLLAFDLFLPPGGHVPAAHVHPLQEERFTILEGRLRFRLRGRRVLALPGETVLVPPGAPHWFGNPGPGPALARVEVRPALRMEEMLEMTEAAARQVGLLRRLLGLGLVLLEFDRELAAPNVPPRLLRALLRLLGWLARSGRHGERSQAA